MAETLEDFLKSYDFMKIGQAVAHDQWQTAMMICRRMEQKTETFELASMQRQMLQIRKAILQKNKIQAKNALALLVQKRVQMLNTINL